MCGYGHVGQRLPSTYQMPRGDRDHGQLISRMDVWTRSEFVWNSENHPHRRYNPLTREWVLVSPQRTDRPWQGQIEEARQPKLPEYDPTCYLCPGNERA